MTLEDALNLKLPPHHLVRGEDGFRVHIAGYPQCTGFGSTAEEAIRVARHLFAQLRDSQTAVCVSDLQGEQSERLREAMRLVVTRALV